jgi:hypothetical protein
MKPVQNILSLLRERKFFFLFAFAKTLPKLLACIAGAFAVHLLISAGSIWSILGVLKIVLFILLLIYYLISFYEAWKAAHET